MAVLTMAVTMVAKRTYLQAARFAVAVAVLAGLAACARPVGTAALSDAPLPAACPAGGTGSVSGAVPSGTTPAARTPLIRRGPVTAVICQYALDPSPKTTDLLTRITLRGAVADGLAAVLDDATEAATPPRCDGLPFRQLILFGYRSGSAVTAGVRFGSCPAGAGVVTAGARAAVIGEPLADDLFSYTGLRAGGKGAVTPDTAGLSAAAAAAAARRHGFSLGVDGAAFDDQVPLGTVIFQSPPPGVSDTGPGMSLDVIVSVPHAPSCGPAKLALDYRGGEASAGNDFGTIVFRDAGAAPCRLAGAVSLTGLNAAGEPVTTTVTADVAGPGVLSPHAAPVPAKAGPGVGELVYGWTLQAEYRDDAAASDGLCTTHWVIPATWRVVLSDGAAFTVRNADPGNRGLSPTGGLVTCRGRLGFAAPPAYF
jgi:hypothetical protein